MAFCMPVITNTFPPHASTVNLAKGTGSHDRIRAETKLDLVDRFVQPQLLLCIFEQIYLISARDQMRKSQTDQSESLTSIIKLLKEFLGFVAQLVVARCVGDASLLGERVEVGIANLHGDASSEFLALSQGKSEFLGHPCQRGAQAHDVDGVFGKCLL